MVRVRGGEFTLGAATQNPNSYDTGSAMGSGSVTLNDFYISRTPITQAQFDFVMGYSDPTYAPPHLFICGRTFFGNNLPTSARPAEQVSWYAAIAFANKLSIMKGRTPVYSIPGIDSLNLDNGAVAIAGWRNLRLAQIPTANNATWNAVTQNLDVNGFRLLTEAEWEFAARGGVRRFYYQDVNGLDRFFANSNNSADIWRHNMSGPHIQSVMTSPPGSSANGGGIPNALGLYDMSGLVSEWVWNWWTVPPALGLNPVGPVSFGNTSERITRGGSWSSHTCSAQVSSRSSVVPSQHRNYIGFRLAASVR